MSKHSALNTRKIEIQPLQKLTILVQFLSQRMTLDGAVNKTAILLSLCLVEHLLVGMCLHWQCPA